MLDEKDLKAIANLIRAETDPLKEEIKQVKSDTMVLMESYFDPKFQLLSEKIDMLQEKMIPAEALDDIVDRLDILEETVQLHSSEIAQLKKAQ